MDGVCDVAYALQVEQLERLALAVVAAGGEPGLVDEVLSRLDESLWADGEGVAVDPERALRLQLLGLRG